MWESGLSILWGLGDSFTMPIVHVLTTGDPVFDDPFNFFFTLMVAMGFLMLIPCAIMKLISRS